jgi:hypothetical protein
MNRNAIWRSPDKAPQDGIDRMNRFWEDVSWRRAAYIESDQPSDRGTGARLNSGAQLQRQNSRRLAGCDLFGAVHECLERC